MHCQKPKPEGFNSRIKFNREQCVKFKVNEAFADVAVTDWCNEKLIAKNIVASYGLTFSCEDALQQIKLSFNILSMKQKFLNTYCKNAINYFKTESVISSFKDAYNKELEELKIQQLKSISSLKGYRNAIAVTVQEHDRYYQEISASTVTDAFDDFYAAQETTEDSHATQEVSESIIEFTDSSLFRKNVFKAGYKYFKKQLSLFDIVNLDKMAKSVNSNSTGEWLDKLSYTILQSETKNETDLALKLSLSRTINLIGGQTMPIFESFFVKHNIKKWEEVKDSKPTIDLGMTQEMSEVYDAIVKKSNEGYLPLRRFICAEKLKAFDDGPESEVIQMLDIVENIVECLIEEDKIDEEKSELGFYRPVAMMLEVLFRKSQFEMKDGETCSSATKKCKQLNEEICDDQDTSSNTIGRRIDLLMKAMDMELSSSEWKRANVGRKLGESQQIKNIRTNTAILESIQSMPIDDDDDDDDDRNDVFVVGMDWLGNVGYMMAIKKVDSAYAAYHISDLALPISLSCLKNFKKTLGLLFFFKHHHFKLKRILAPCYRRQRNNQALNMYRSSSGPAKRSKSPGTFFSPKRKQQRRTSADAIDSEED